MLSPCHRPLTCVAWTDFWLLKEHMNPLNETVSRVPLRIDVQPLSMMKMQIFASLEHSFKEAAAKGQPTGEMDEVKRMFTETSPWLLGTTVIVSILHMIFEFVAFSSDVSHWRKCVVLDLQHSRSQAHLSLDAQEARCHRRLCSHHLDQRRSPAYHSPLPFRQVCFPRHVKRRRDKERLTF